MGQPSSKDEMTVRGHLWVGRIVAIAADCKSADSGLRQFESGPAHLCLRVRVKLKV